MDRAFQLPSVEIRAATVTEPLTTLRKSAVLVAIVTYFVPLIADRTLRLSQVHVAPNSAVSLDDSSCCIHDLIVKVKKQILD